MFLKYTKEETDLVWKENSRCLLFDDWLSWVGDRSRSILTYLVNDSFVDDVWSVGCFSMLSFEIVAWTSCWCSRKFGVTDDTERYDGNADCW